jgi:hypothetical protein
VQAPDNTQSLNRYSYCVNNPLKYTDPSGELFVVDDIIVGAIVGAIIGGYFSGIQSLNSGGDFWDGCWKGALVGGVTGALSGGLSGGSTGILGNILWGTATGAFTGAVSVVLTNTLNGGCIWNGVGEAAWKGGVFGGILGGIRGVIIKVRTQAIFTRGCEEMGTTGDAPIAPTDANLSIAQKAWFKGAPMDKVKAFTVENVPENDLTGKSGLITNNAAAKTVPSTLRGVLTGHSNVYFNKDLAFNSAKQLFFTMGHELVHVSQFAALAGQQISLILNSDFISMLEFHAYSYQNSLGGLQYNSFTRDDIIKWSVTYSQFNSMNYTNFSWTFNHSYIYPF